MSDSENNSENDSKTSKFSTDRDSPVTKSISPATESPVNDAENISYDELAEKKGQEEEERKKEEERKRMEAIDRIKDRTDPLSVPWSIGDAPCLMLILQIFVWFICIWSLYITFEQTQIDVSCDKEDSYFGPFVIDGENGCLWPKTNVIARVIAPGLGALCSFIIVMFTVCCGRVLYKTMDSYNENNMDNDLELIEESKEKKPAEVAVEYYEVYNVWYFRVMKLIIGISAMIQFVSLGLDWAQYSVGRHYAQSISEGKGVSSAQFQAPLVIGVPVAMLLVFTVKSIYIQPRKKNIKIKFDVEMGTTYTHTTHKKRQTRYELNPNANESVMDGRETRTNLYPPSMISGGAPSIRGGSKAPSVISQ